MDWRLLPLVFSLALSACSYTDIERVVVQTNVGAGCSVQRGKTVDAQGQGQAEANVLTQSGTGAAAGALSELLSSVADCKPALERGITP